MRKNYFLFLMGVLGLVWSVNAQTVEINDDMESYTVGNFIFQNHWTDWGCGGTMACSLISSNAQAHSGTKSGYVGGNTTTDAVLNLGNKIFGEWGLSFYMYVPTGKEAYFNLQGVVPIGAGQWIVGNIFFNEALGAPGQGSIDMSTSATTDDVTFAFPHDQWFKIIINVNLNDGVDAGTWQFYVNGVEAVPAGTPFANGAGTYPTSYGGIDFYSISANNEFWLDDIYYQDASIVASVNDQLATKGFVSYPNPVQNELNLRANEVINNVTISNMLGQVVLNSNVNALQSSVDISSLNHGTYVVTVKIGETLGSYKIVK